MSADDPRTRAPLSTKNSMAPEKKEWTWHRGNLLLIVTNPIAAVTSFTVQKMKLMVFICLATPRQCSNVTNFIAKAIGRGEAHKQIQNETSQHPP